MKFSRVNLFLANHTVCSITSYSLPGNCRLVGAFSQTIVLDYSWLITNLYRFHLPLCENWCTSCIFYLNSYGMFLHILYFSKKKITDRGVSGTSVIVSPLREVSKKAMIILTTCHTFFWLLWQKMLQCYIKRSRVLVSTHRCSELERELVPNLQWKKSWQTEKSQPFLSVLEYWAFWETSSVRI